MRAIVRDGTRQVKGDKDFWLQYLHIFCLVVHNPSASLHAYLRAVGHEQRSGSAVHKTDFWLGGERVLWRKKILILAVRSR
jgi:hypothetical protein